MPKAQNGFCTTETTIKAKSCCEDQHQILEMDEEAESTSVTSLINLPFLVAYTATFLKPTLFTTAHNTQFSYYSPPIPIQDAQVLFQSFLL